MENAVLKQFLQVGMGYLGLGNGNCMKLKYYGFLHYNIGRNLIPHQSRQKLGVLILVVISGLYFGLEGVSKQVLRILVDEKHLVSDHAIFGRGLSLKMW